MMTWDTRVAIPPKKTLLNALQKNEDEVLPEILSMEQRVVKNCAVE